MIQDRLSSNKEEPDIREIQLAKISPANYIGHLRDRNMSEDKIGEKMMTEGQKRLSEVKKFLDPLNANF